IRFERTAFRLPKIQNPGFRLRGDYLERNISDNSHPAFVNESFRTTSPRTRDATRMPHAQPVRVHGSETRREQSLCCYRFCRSDLRRLSADIRSPKNPPA